MRIGNGYDVHKFVPGRRLILGGVDIAHEQGLLGHSDADVLVHAVMDALLGALAMRDIGAHFPDTDAQYRDISSLKLLERVHGLISAQGYSVCNVDSVIVAQRPKLAAYIPDMVENIARALDCSVSRVNVKATTEEGLGFTGAGQGISSYAVCLLKKTEGRGGNEE